ncbi:DUF86 domain-containing protein [Ignisphaera sp. 4213-co]|uniref:DUF86 domain-containing protein n=1 Tax=Ignisphaera cupida TaxID=3050454 RepID=A0ABD4Z3M5_9CREN|nr:HepT-like ribonuclease domain-containing protein [Ignisphaera sp. 4213-co]MDK6027921.1 DUF86 domain-containing protein [Ignisphaera sp. 4213-co]
MKLLRSKVRDLRYFEDYVLRGAIERYLHLAIEAIIDVGMRIASILKLIKPERYRDVAKIFRECGVLSYDESKRLELWIGLRNVLVHGYARIDYGKLYEVLQNIEELENFVNRIFEYVANRGVDPQKESLSNIVDSVKKVLEKRSNIVFAYVFGSYATGVYRDESDVDVAIYTRNSMGWRELVELILELEDATNKKVDVVDLRTAPLLLACEVVSKGIVVVDRGVEERIDFEVKTLKECLDFRPRLEKYYSEVLSRQA